MILWRNFHFLSFNTNPRFPPFLLYVRCKSGVTFVRRCFRDEQILTLIALSSYHNPFNASISKGDASSIFNAFGMAWQGANP